MSVISDLKRARRAARSSSLATGGLQWLAISGIIWIVLFGADNLLILPGALRFPLAVIAALWTIGSFVIWVARPFLARRTLAQTARLLEKRYGTEHNTLINSLQLSADDCTEAEAAFVEQTVNAGESSIRKLPLGEMWQFGRIIRLAAVAILATLGWAAYAHLSPDMLKNAAYRFALPFADTPPLGKVEIELHPADDLTVVEGDSLQIYALIKRRDADSEAAISAPTIIMRTGRKAVSPTRIGNTRGIPMAAVSRSTLRAAFTERTGEAPSEDALHAYGTPVEQEGLLADSAIFVHEAPDITRPFAFRVFHDGGGTYSKNVMVDVHLAPRIKGSQFHVTPPEYTGSDPVSSLGPPHSVTGLAGSKLEVELMFDHPVEQLVWEADGQSVPFVRDGDSWRATTTLTSSCEYSVSLKDETMKSAILAASGSILLREDRHPQIDFTSSARSQTVRPGSSIKLALAGSDDFGLKNARVTVRSARGDGERSEIKAWEFGAAPGMAEPFFDEFTLPLDASTFEPGQDYILEAMCEDFHPDGQRGLSRPFVLKVQEIGAEDHLVYEANQGWLGELDKAIAEEQKALSATRRLIEFLPETLGQEASQTTVNYSFTRHQNKLASNQTTANATIARVAELAAKPVPKVAEEVAALHRVHCARVSETIGKLARPKYWLGDDVSVHHSGAVSEKVTFPKVDARYLAFDLTGANGKEVRVSEMQPLDALGDDMPTEAIRHWRLSSTVLDWKNWDKFPNLSDAQREEIVKSTERAKLFESNDAYVNIGRQILQRDFKAKAHYLVTMLATQEARQIRLLAGSNDSLRIWVNGKLALQSLGLRKAVPDQDIALADFIDGKNLILVELAHSKSPIGFYFRLEEMNGAALGRAQYGRLAAVPNPKVVHVTNAHPKLPLRNAFDRDPNTSWQANGERPAFLVLDYGQPLTIGGFRYETMRQGHAKYDVYAFNELPALKHLRPPLQSTETQQAFILDTLIAIRTAHGGATESAEDAKDEGEEGLTEMLVEELVDDFMAEAEAYKEATLDTSKKRESIIKDASDFSGEEEAELESLKVREARLAQKLKQAVRDLSVLGDLDMADQSQSEALQSFLDDANRLEEAAEEKAEERPNNDTENLDTDVIGLVEELSKNGEFTFPEDVTKNELEQSEDETNAVPLVELPQELEDIVGEAEEAQMELDDELADVGASLVSLDLGEGAIMPGANSSNTAQGKTGNQQPENKTEHEGRSGFGRTGMSNGQGVEDVAKKVEQNDQQTLARNTTSPLESGEVRDEDPGAAQNATGLGKSTDATTQFGMDGELPDAVLKKMQEVAAKQQQIRAKTEAVRIRLGAHNIPTDELDKAIDAMEAVEVALKEGNAQKLRQAYSDSLRLTGEVRRTIGRANGLDIVQERTRERHSARRHVAGRTAPPKGYERMVGAFFEELANE